MSWREGWMFRRLWNYIKDTELYFQLFDLKYPKIRFEGSCKLRGECCRNLLLGYRFRAIRTLKEFEKEKKRNAHYEMFIPQDKRLEDGYLRFSCSKLTEDNKCGIHETRPEMCRRYPDPEMVRYGGTLLPGCGYRLVSEKSFDSYLGEKLERAEKKNKK